MDNPTSQINIIKSNGGKKFNMPKIHPAVIIVVTILLAIVTVVSVALLYQKKQTPIAAPTTADASTTTTISPAFSDPKWTLNQPPAGQMAVTNGNLVMNNVSSGAGVAQWSDQITGDFTATVHLDASSANDNNIGLLEFFDSANPPAVDVTWIKTSTESTVALEDNGKRDGQLTIPTSVTALNLRLTRVAGSIQAFVDSGSGYQLVGTTPFANDGKLQVMGSGNLAFSNFTAQVNPAAVQPTPVPGSTAACALTFNVLDTAPTGTPTPTPTITGTPAPTPTGTISPTPTPTVTPTPPPGSTPLPTPTPTTPIVLGPTPTPVLLQTAGSMTGTLVLGLGGALILGLGAILMFVF